MGNGSGVQRFLDAHGRLTTWPAKHKDRLQMLDYLVLKFDPNRHYTEHEINELLQNWHTFGDWALLRRELYDQGYMNRTTDGYAYWRER